MSVEAYATFLSQMGRRVRRVDGIYWYDTAPRVYTSIPYDRMIDPYTLDLPSVLGRDGLAARFPCAREVGRHSHRYVCGVTDYGFNNLAPRARTQTRRGLERCQVRPARLEELLAQGVSLNRDTLERQGRTVPAGFEAYWNRYYRVAAVTEGADLWGAFADGNLAAYLVAFRIDACAHITVLRSGTRWLKHFPNNALLFTYLRDTLATAAIREVSIGVESLQPEMETLERFKRHLGFRLVEIGQRIELAPRLRAIVPTSVARGLDRLIRPHVRTHEFLGKLCGMLRWYGEQPRLHT